MPQRLLAVSLQAQAAMVLKRFKIPIPVLMTTASMPTMHSKVRTRIHTMPFAEDHPPVNLHHVRYVKDDMVNVLGC